MMDFGFLCFDYLDLDIEDTVEGAGDDHYLEDASWRKGRYICMYHTCCDLLNLDPNARAVCLPSTIAILNSDTHNFEIRILSLRFRFPRNAIK